MPTFKGNFNTIKAWKAPFWTREGGRGVFLNSLAAGENDVAWDNQYNVVVYDSQSNVIPSFLASDANGAFQVNNPNGLVVAGQMAQPAAPTVTPNTTGGGTTVAYAIVGRTSSGLTSQVSTATQITTSAAVLSASVFNTITGTLQTGFAYYDIYRTVAGGTPNTTGKIGTVAASTLLKSPSATTFTFTDTGIAGDGSTAPAINTTGGIISSGGFGIGTEINTQTSYTLTAAQIAAMYATPVTIIPAPGAGKVLNINDIVLQTKPGGTNFAAGGAVNLQYHGTSVTPHASSIPATTINSGTASVNSLPPPAGVIQIPVNTGLDITNATQAFTTGTGTAVVTVAYTILTLS
jgi:hypothetical protein